MELIRVSDRVWYSMYEVERDRPCLGYVRGDRWSLAVDAGHSDAHVEEFYDALRRAHLPLPSITVVTHWHWDHAFGMHHTNGICIANSRTNQHLRDFAAKMAREGEETFLSLDPSIRKEYADGRKAVIVPADIEFDHELSLDQGGITAHLFACISPHTDDSTLVCIPEEKILFVGDSISGIFPTWERDLVKTRELIHTIEGIDVKYCLGGHWVLLKKKELLAALEEGAV